MKNTCIPHPPRELYVLIRPWQVEACDGNLCAAALLSYFEYWHNVKLDHRNQARSLNDVAEKHGESRAQDESLLQWHTVEELRDGLLGLYGRNVILTAVKLLESLGFITIQRNPNPAYKWDKTNHYLLCPKTIMAWLRDHRGLDQDYSPATPVKSDSLKINYREFKNKLSIVEKGTIDATENKLAIPEISSEITPEIKDIALISPSPADADEGTSIDTPAAKFVNWWNEQIVPLGGRPFSFEDADEKFITKANKALRAQKSKGFWDRVKHGFEGSRFLRGEITPTEGKKRFKASLTWLLSLHYQKKIMNYTLVVQNEWADDPLQPPTRPVYQPGDILPDGSKKGKIL